MFQDNRGKRIIFLAHCVCNQNSISDGTATFSGTNETVLRLLLDAKIGIVQLPCPEMNCLGLDRGDKEGANRPLLEENSRIRNALIQTDAKRILELLVQQASFQIKEYIHYGFEIIGIIGINRSPSCGINTTSKDNAEVEGKGVFFEMLAEELSRCGFNIPILGIKDSEPEQTKESIIRLLNE